jgi:DNA-binding response OmpR family regulator
MRIAVAEDDVELSRFLGDCLRNASHTVKEFKDGDTIIKHLKRDSFDVVLLDWQMPGRTGIETLRWIRENLDPAPPVIMVTSRASEADIVKALGAGADDYIIKPVQPAVLMARLAAVARRSYPDIDKLAVETFHNYTFDNRTRCVTIGDEVIELAAKEFALALLMMRNSHRPLSRGYLLENIWGHDGGIETRTLDVHISQIRKRLRLRPENGLRLSSIYSFGYRLDWILDEAEDHDD